MIFIEGLGLAPRIFDRARKSRSLATLGITMHLVE